MDAGLGGVFRGQIWSPGEDARYESRSLWKYEHNSKRYVQNERKHESSIWPEDYNALALDNVDYDVSRDVGGLLHFTTDYAQKLFDLNQDILDSLEIIHPRATESNRIGFL